MGKSNFQKIIDKVNSRARVHPIGRLYEIRKNLKGFQRLPPRKLFTSQTTSAEWAFHHGGRKELQFNIGLEDENTLRHGVAFSLQTNQTLPDITKLYPSIRLFNDFIQLYSEEYSDMRMWHYHRGERSPISMPSCIPSELLSEGVFIFLGKIQPLKNPDVELILRDFDRLLSLYQYVESKGLSQPIYDSSKTPFEFRSGFLTDRASKAKASQAAKEIDIDLRHNILQKALRQKLSRKFGAKNVTVENPSGIGTNIDIVVRQKKEYWFYEIKTSHSPRACIRQAIGQLLEYAFWPGTQAATRLIVVGEEVLDEEGKGYLRELRKRFSLPIEYEQIII